MELDTASSIDAVQDKSALNPNHKNILKLDHISAPIHFIGIGGIGMSALARLLLAQGRQVSGSDKQASPITDELQALGAIIYIGQKESNVEKAGAIIVSTAITNENPEYARGKALDLPFFHRSELLFYLSLKSKVIAVSGTHGKTTTTGMISQVLLDCGLDPTVVVGGVFERLKSNSYAGSGEYFVAEADESDRSHASMESYVAVVTNIEPDHLENYPGGLEQILDTMASFANHCEFATLLCSDDPGCRQLIPRIKKRVITYGSKENSPDADYQMELNDDQSFIVYANKKKLGQVELAVPGKHNKENALCACALALELGVKFDDIAKALSNFVGVDRRFQHLGQAQEITVIDDYGHHPTEVLATLEAAQQYKRFLNTKDTVAKKRRVVAVFQPHQPGRLRDLWDDFCLAFTNADLVLITDIYVARGSQIEGISSERFTKVVQHNTAHYLSGATSGLAEKIMPYLEPGDIVLTIGAGDITSVGKPLLELLAKDSKNGRAK